jgi:hypothetical protein
MNYGKSDKQLADEIDARKRLESEGAKRVSCKIHKGVPTEQYCPICRGKGYYWEFPLMR